MRVLHFVDSSGMYGTEAVILELVRHQLRKGHDAAIVSIGSPGDGEKDLEREARRVGITVHPIRMMNGPNPRGAVALLKLAQQTRTDILHSHGYKSNILLGMTPRRYRPQAMVCTLHGYTHAAGVDRMRLYRWLDLRAVRRADAVVLVHTGMRKNAGLASLDSKSVFVIENGLPGVSDTGGDLDPRIRDFCAAGPIIGAVGRLSREKAFDVLIAAFHELVKDGRDERLLIFGEGPERPALEQLIESLGLKDRVLLPGFVNIGRYLPFLKVFVLPSLTEGLPICILEAMRAGLPIVATRVGGVADVLGDGTCGVLVPPGDASALKRAIGEVLRNEVLARSLVRHSEAAVRAYSGERMTDRYLALYAQLLPVTSGQDRSSDTGRSAQRRRGESK